MTHTDPAAELERLALDAQKLIVTTWRDGILANNWIADEVGTEWAEFIAACSPERIAQLVALARAGMEDTARLDWLLESMLIHNVENRAALVVRAWNRAHPHGGILTLDSKCEAIDSARAARAPAGPGGENA